MEGFTAAKPGASRWEMKRPACLAAASFLGTTALFIPLYQGWMLPQQSLGKRIFCLGMLLLALLAAALAAQFGCKREVWRCRRLFRNFCKKNKPCKDAQPEDAP